MKKKLVMLLTAVATCATLMMACGNSEAAATDETAVEAEATEDAAAETEGTAGNPSGNQGTVWQELYSEGHEF